MIKEGKVIFKTGWFVITDTGIRYSITACLRLLGMLIAGLVFVWTTRVEEISAGIKGIGVPYRIAFAITAAIRLLPAFLGAGAIILQAQESRGFELQKGNFINRLKNYIPLLIPSFLYGMRNVHILSMALEAKGFSGKNKTSYIEHKITFIDVIAFILLTVILFISIFFRYLGYGMIVNKI